LFPALFYHKASDIKNKESLKRFRPNAVLCVTGGDGVSGSFAQIYNEYFSDVYKYALSLCRNELLAEEVTQETFFKAMRSMDKFNGTCKLYVWLCQIAKNTYFSLYQKRKRYVSSDDTDLQAEIDIEAACLDSDTANQLHVLLHNLDEPYKEVFTLRVFGELPFIQIGELFGKTDSWARLVFYRAKKQLQEGIK
jgi:RNA polymerase sigma-70 factor (ECF subfamily)